MFKLYVQFLSDAGLLGKTTIGADGSKFKAVDTKKNNFNQNKIDKHQQFIKDKTEKYRHELDEMDTEESNTSADELQKMLHLCELTAIKYYPEFRQYFDRKKAESKNEMLVLNAIKIKLVLRVAAVVNKQQP